MAQYSSRTKTLLNNNKSLYEVMISADQFGRPVNQGGSSPLNVAGSSAYGEIMIAETTPVFQLDGLYGIDDDNEFQKNTISSGTQFVDENGLISVSSGTSANGFAAIRSKRSIRYRPGQGSILRFTAMFPSGHAVGYQQVAGYLNQSDILAVGYNAGANEEFGVLRRYKSLGELWELDFTAGTAGSANTLEITLNSLTGPATTQVVIPSGKTAQEAATIVGNTSFTNWLVDYSGTKVWFLYGGPPVDLSDSPGFSFENITGGGVVTATFNNIQQGSAPTDTWAYRSQWNLDKLDGSGPSGMNLDPSKLNVYQIDFRWLGAGIIRYSIEDQISGNIIPFHIEHITNSSIRAHISNPSMRAGYAVVNVDPNVSPLTDVQVKGGSIMGAIQGKVVQNNTHKASYNIIGSSDANEAHHALSLKNDRINIDGTISQINQREILIDFLSATADTGAGGKPVIVYLYKNATLRNDPGLSLVDVNFEYNQVFSGVSNSKQVAWYKEGSGILVTALVVGSNDALNINMTSLRLILAPEETLSIFIESSSSIADADIALTYSIE